MSGIAHFSEMVGASIKTAEYHRLDRDATHEWTEEELLGYEEAHAELERTQADFALWVAASALTAYQSGEMELLAVLNIASTASHVCSREVRRALLGEIALLALKMGPPKTLNRRKATFPPWIKRLAVDMILQLKATRPLIPLEPPRRESSSGGKTGSRSAIEWTAEILSALRICPVPRKLCYGDEDWLSSTPPRPIATRTLHRWYRERMLELGQNSAPGRPRTKAVRK